MASELESIQKMVYPGRVIVIGQSPAGENVVMYAITGRSPSSQARKLEIDEAGRKIVVRPTDEETLRTGNPDLLVYPAIMCSDGIAVSNGKQTEDVFKQVAAEKDPAEVLLKGLAAWEYEPDEPNYTPRISGCITGGAALSILKRAEDGSVMRNTFGIPLIPGKGRVVSTYTGENSNPLPSFSGEPGLVEIPWQSADEAACSLYEALGPSDGRPDFRVAAAAVYSGSDKSFSMRVKNRHP